MKPYYADDTVALYGPGDCRKLLPNVTEGSVDAIVTDPPYEYAFMGKDWDATGAAFDVVTWRRCLDVLKPGGWLLAFGGTRTYHRMVCAIEDAGFEIRDSMHWIYGSGFPKSLDVGKAIDRRRDDRDAINEVTGWLARQRDRAGLTNRDIDEAFDFHGMAGHWTAAPHLKIAQVPRWDQWERLRDLLGFDNEMDAEVWRLNGRKGTPGHEREDRVVAAPSSNNVFQPTQTVLAAGTPVLKDAAHWAGWGTALKPAHEPIVLARKPLGGTVAANVLTHGTGALNIDACRTVAGQDYRDKCASVVGLDSNRNGDAYGEWAGTRVDSAHAGGRWPTNVVLTHQPLVDDTGNIIGDACADGCVPGCPVADMDAQSGTRTSWMAKTNYTVEPSNEVYGKFSAQPVGPQNQYGDTGGASRFFPVFRYEAKAPSSERPRAADGTAHATVKPLALMRWLVRLATQPGGVVLDPFLGSGTTAEACIVEGFRCVGVELDPGHLELVTARLSKPIQPTLGGAS